MPRGIDTRYSASRRPLNPMIYEGRRELGEGNPSLTMPSGYDMEEMYPDDPEHVANKTKERMSKRTTLVDAGMPDGPKYTEIKGETKVTYDPTIMS